MLWPCYESNLDAAVSRRDRLPVLMDRLFLYLGICIWI